MIPLHDDQPTKIVPFVTIVLILINAWVFIGWQLQVGIERSVMQAAMVPAEFTGSPEPGDFRNMLSSMFMHGGWMHLIGNMWFLWIFGNNIEDAMGHVRFVVFYLLCGVLADFAHIAASPFSTVPMIGASGAVSGVLGAYLVLHPRARVMTLVPLGLFTRIMPLPAWMFLLLWIVLQIVSQLVLLGRTNQSPQGGVAYLAHIGGYVAGLVLIFFFKKERRSRSVERFS